MSDLIADNGSISLVIFMPCRIWYSKSSSSRIHKANAITAKATNWKGHIVSDIPFFVNISSMSWHLIIFMKLCGTENRIRSYAHETN